MFLLDVNPGTLGVNFWSRFGVTAAGSQEWGHSLYEVPAGNGRTAGFIVCGLSNSYPTVLGDPQNMYVVKTNATGTTQCSGGINSNTGTPTGNTCITPTIYTVVTATNASAGQAAPDWYSKVCASTSSKTTSGGAVQNDEPAMSGSSEPVEQNIRFQPNPVKRGNNLSLEFTPSGTAEIEITVYDNAGRIVGRSSAVNTGAAMTIPMTTDGLPAGSYVVNVSDGTKTNIVQVIVTE